MSVWTFGATLYGQLGRAHRPRLLGGDPLLPGLVTEFAGDAEDARDVEAVAPTIAVVAAGDWHSAAVSADGRLYCWGNNAEGQCVKGPGRGPKVMLPQLVGGVLKDRVFVGVACGGHFTLALTQSGEVFAWGKLDTAVIQPTFIEIRHHGLPCKIVSIKCGWAHAACIDSEGRMFVFGAGAFGRLGLGHNEDVYHYAPQVCPASLKLRVDKVALGMSFSLVLLQNGDLYASGDNSRGQLGIGKFGGMRSSPVQVHTVGQDRIAHIAAGCDHAAAVTVNGRVLTWGDNKYGTLGTGDRENCHTPSVVQALSSFNIVNAGCGGSHTLFVTDLGKVYMCGGGSALVGIINQGTVIHTPQELAGVQHITYAVGGVEHSVLLAGQVRGTSSLGVDWLRAFNRADGNYADVRFVLAGGAGAGHDPVLIYAHRCVLASSAFFMHLLTSRRHNENDGDKEQPAVTDIELPHDVSARFFEKLLLSFYGGERLTKLELLAAQSDLTSLHQMAPTLASLPKDDPQPTAAAATVIDNSPSVSSTTKQTSAGSSKPPLLKKLRGWFSGSAPQQGPIDSPATHTPPPAQSEPVPSIVAWALDCLVPSSGAVEGGGESEQQRRTPSTASAGLEDHMRSMVDNPLFSDVSFAIGGRSIRAHKAVLALRCSYFATMFSAGMRESVQQEISMDGSDCSFGVFRRMLAYLYTNTLDDVSPVAAAHATRRNDDNEDDGWDEHADKKAEEEEEEDNEEEAEEEDEEEGEEMPLDDYVQLMNVAESFDLPHLKYLAEDRAIACINISTVAQLLDTAEVLRASSLAKSCFVFLLQNWHDIKRDHPDVETHLDDAVKRKIEDHLRRTFRL